MAAVRGWRSQPHQRAYSVPMARLIYAAIASLDGYVEDERGEFGWAAPGEEVHAFVNELERPIGTYLYGRRMYETMVSWETSGSGADESAAMREYAGIWRAAEKIVYSRTLEAPSSARARIEHDFEPGAIEELKRTATRDLTVGGAELAGQALAEGLVDELSLLVNPIIVGAGKPALPDGFSARLELLEERRFAGGVVHLRYALGN